MLTSEFTYELPEAAIAQTPAHPRDSARLLDAGDLVDYRFTDLPSLVRPGDLVVVNDTKVRAARLKGRKEGTGGEVELLLLEPFGDSRWKALVRPARRLRAGTRIRVGQIVAEVVEDPMDGVAVLALDAPTAIEDAIESSGELPLPPYIKESLHDPDDYQTIFASTTGSAAAPTAGLHFTPQVVAGLRARGVDVARVELRVGIGTFRPIATETVEAHVMHSEWVNIPEDAARSIRATRQRGGAVVAVGTTVTRTLESRAVSGGVEPGSGTTDLFIAPGYDFKVVDRLITNFHVPGSSLIVMVAAFMGPRWRQTYEVALERGYRFLSFGDAMIARRAGR